MVLNEGLVLEMLLELAWDTGVWINTISMDVYVDVAVHDFRRM